MRTRLVSLVPCLAALSIAGCASGSNPPKAGDFAGFWTFTSLTVSDGTRAPVTLSRGASGYGVRGDVTVTAQSDTELTLYGRLAMLQDGLPIGGAFQEIASPVVLDGDTWLIHTGETVAAFHATLEGDGVTLFSTPKDPRNTAVDPPQRIVLRRTDRWTTRASGAWDVTGLVFADGSTMEPDVCVDAGDGRSATWSQLVTIDDRWLVSMTQTVRVYSDPLCTTETERSVSGRDGFAEENGGVFLQMWTWEREKVDDPAWIGFVVNGTPRSDGTLTLTRVGCLPYPDCTANQPIDVTITPAKIVK